MNNKRDFEFICVSLGNLCNGPIRLFRNQKEIFCYSPIHLLKDPFVLDKEPCFALEDELTYFQNSLTFYYGIIYIKEYRIIAGPFRQFPATKQELKSIAFSLGLSKDEIDEFASQMEVIPPLSLFALLQTMCLAFYSLTGKKKSLEDAAIHELEQERIQEEIAEKAIKRTVDDLEGKPQLPYTALDAENRLLDMIMRGDVSALKDYMSHIPAVKGGVIASEQLRQAKNIFIVTATLASRAAIRGGLDVTSALALSDSYIQACELASSTERITELNYRMVLDYADRVAKIKLGQDQSVFVAKVSNYIQQHLSEPIKVEEIAKALYMGRSRLSTNFKKETGIDLSSYIMQLKIDEAKRLLRYSDKSFTAIATYLGFSSPSHFTSTFKKHTGSTPLDYRKARKHY